MVINPELAAELKVLKEQFREMNKNWPTDYRSPTYSEYQKRFENLVASIKTIEQNPLENHLLIQVLCDSCGEEGVTRDVKDQHKGCTGKYLHGTHTFVLCANITDAREYIESEITNHECGPYHNDTND